MLHYANEDAIFSWLNKQPLFQKGETVEPKVETRLSGSNQYIKNRKFLVPKEELTYSTKKCQGTLQGRGCQW